MSEFSLINKIPHSIDIEKTLLGLLLLNDKNYIECRDIVTFSDFALPQHQTLYYAIEQLYLREKKIDVHLLLDYIKSNELMEKIGGEVYFIELQTIIENSESIPNMAKIIRKKHHRRQIQEITVNLHAKLKEDLNYTDDEIDKLITDIVNANNSTLDESYSTAKSALAEAFNQLAKQSASGIMSGYPYLDEIIGGFKTKHLIVLAARPSMGKTMLALNMAMNMVRNKIPVAFLSLEMSKTDIALRAMVSMTGIPYGNIVSARVTSEEWESLTNLSVVFSEMPLFISEATMDMKEIRRTTRKLKQEHNIQVLFIDYLQLIAGTKYTDNRNLEIGWITKELKALAKELDIAVILLSQLNRSLEARMDKRPVASDLRDSGSIEQDADIVMFIYRDVVYNQEANPKEAELIVNKNRNGQSHLTVMLEFSGKSMTFKSLQKDIETFG